ncbi:hypothetical protein [Scytonema sp. PCC 10023]|uniref:hypothetical protein n=1 Tax=Scytonema sp. PCC 10023 TaxID=1680591 RepID=UPI0039C716A6
MKDTFSWEFKPQLKVRSQCRGEAALREGFPRAGSAFMVSRLETSGVLRINVGVLDPLIYDKNF